MKIRLEGGLPYVTVSLVFRGQEISLDRVLLDTGSAGSVFASDEVEKLGLLPEPTDPLRRIRGVGGSEFVFSKRLDRLALDSIRVPDFEIQVGAMDYGFPIQGLLGMDFLRRANVVIDLGRMDISQNHSAG